MKTISKHHIEAIEKAKTELGKVNAASLALISEAMGLIKAVLLKHEVAVIEVMCELHQQQQADEALLRQALEAMQSAMQSHGVILASDPPQDAWKFYGVGNKMNGAIAAIKERLK